MLPKESLDQLKTFLNVVKGAPQILHTPELAFFREFIESFGGSIPPVACSKESSKPPTSEEKTPVPPENEQVSSEESEVELDNAGVIENPDQDIEDDDDYELNPAAEVDEEIMQKVDEKKIEAIAQYAEKNYEKALELFSEAIKLNPGISLLYVKRGQCYLQLEKPNACIRECNKALRINPDNAGAYKFRGRAHRLLGHWIEAAKDLRNACHIDFDEQANDWLKEVTPNAIRKTVNREKKLKKNENERTAFEKNEKQNSPKKSETNSAKKSQPARDVESKTKSDKFSKAGKYFAQYYHANFYDPELRAAWHDPEIVAMYNDIGRNPLNVLKYINHPKYIANEKLLKRKKAAGILPKEIDPEAAAELKECAGDPEFFDATRDMYNDPENAEKYMSNPKIRHFMSYIPRPGSGISKKVDSNQRRSKK